MFELLEENAMKTETTTQQTIQHQFIHYHLPETRDFIEAWKKNYQDATQRAKLTPAHFALYIALKGKNWLKAFTPITSQVKLDNGQKPCAASSQTLEEIYNAIQRDYSQATMSLRSEKNDSSFQPSKADVEQRIIEMEKAGESRATRLLEPFDGTVDETDLILAKEIMMKQWKEYRGEKPGV